MKSRKFFFLLCSLVHAKACSLITFSYSYNILIFSKAYNIATVKKYEKEVVSLKKINNNNFYFSHCMVVGDRQKHLACLLTVKAVMDPATLEVTTQGPNN
jgi:hypothetical protein